MSSLYVKPENIKATKDSKPTIKQASPRQVKKKEFLGLSLSFMLVTLFCIISYFYFDQPIAIYLSQFHHDALSEFSLSSLSVPLTELVYFLTLILMLLYAYLHYMNIKHRWMEISGILSLGMVISFFIKSQLQYLFGRIAPRYIGSNQLLFMRKSTLYGFHPFMSGSFPSGHMVIFTCLLLLFSFYYPKSRSLCYLLLGLLAFLLIFYNYHFLSDVVAGTYVGALIALALKLLLRDKFKQPA